MCIAAAAALLAASIPVAEFYSITGHHTGAKPIILWRRASSTHVAQLGVVRETGRGWGRGWGGYKLGSFGLLHKTKSANYDTLARLLIKCLLMRLLELL